MKTLPNIISVFRICLVPIFVMTFMLDDNEVKGWAIVIFVIANASDILDGYIARRFDASSTLGRVLDPLADKLIVFSALICIATVKPILIWVVCIYFIKEVLKAVGGYHISKIRNVELPSSNILGKATTVTFFAMCVAMLIFPDISDTVAIAMMVPTVGLALVAFVNYLLTYIKIIKASRIIGS